MARVGPKACVVDLDDACSLRLDAEGRWASLRDGDLRLRRTVDARVLRSVDRGFAPCDPAETRAAHERARDIGRRVMAALAGLPADRVHLIGERAALTAQLQLGLQWTAERFEDERRRASHAYRVAVSIVPPHRYRDLVLQPALGCPSNACSFCDLYGDRRFEVPPLAAFAAHVRAVRDLLGRAAAERDGIFFDSGSALSLPVEALEARLEVAHEVLGRRARSVAAFYDPDRGELRDARTWARLAAAGLSDATVGLETGSGALRAAVRKAPGLDRFTEVVRCMKAGGMRVAVTVLVGLGGAEAAGEHVARTAERVGTFGLDAGDIVYLSRLVGSMDEAALDQQTRDLRVALKAVTAARAGAYRLERFDYFA